jgi:hypothetical protein
VKRQAVVALMVLVALSFGCGKSETTHGTRGVTPKDAGEKSAELPADFPRDVPILQGATVKVVMSQGKRTVVHLYTSNSIADAAKFYNTEFRAQGWRIETAENTREMSVVSAKKGKILCGVTVSKEGKRTLVRLAVSEEGS